MTSVFGPYVDQLLLPQLRELAGDYGVDGVWVDGECWATIPDYGEEASRRFREATGFGEIHQIGPARADPRRGRRGRLGTIAAWAAAGLRCTAPVPREGRRPFPTWAVSRLITSIRTS